MILQVDMKKKVFLPEKFISWIPISLAFFFFFLPIMWYLNKKWLENCLQNQRHQQYIYHNSSYHLHLSWLLVTVEAYSLYMGLLSPSSWGIIPFYIQ